MMKKWIGMILVVALIAVMATGCTKNLVASLVDEAQSQEESQSAAEESQDTAAEVEVEDSGLSDTGSTGSSLPGDAYTAYTDAKSALTTNILDGMAADENLAELSLTASMDLLSLAMSDLALIPLAFFGMSDADLAMGLGIMGAADVKSQTNGNDFTMSYTDSEGSVEEMTAKYDPASDSMTTELSVDGKFYMLSEYTKTSNGYAGQVYSLSDDGTYYTIKVLITSPDNMNGTIGVSYNQSTEPSSVFGKGDAVGADFAKDSDNWYAVSDGVYSASVEGVAY